MTAAILTLLLGYALMAALLLALHLKSALAWQIKAAATLLAGVATVLTLDAAHGLLGWPTAQSLPETFRLHGAHVVEPRADSDGAIHLWVTVDGLVPRAHQMPYSRELHEQLHRAQGALEDGEAVHGRQELRDGDNVPELELYTAPSPVPPDKGPQAALEAW